VRSFAFSCAFIGTACLITGLFFSTERGLAIAVAAMYFVVACHQFWASIKAQTKAGGDAAGGGC
jgi:hypothetical protein